MSAIPSFVAAGGVEYRVHSDGIVIWRYSSHGGWSPVVGDDIRSLAVALADVESRANEYYDTTVKQAQRIAELERAVVEAGRQLKNIHRSGGTNVSAYTLTLPLPPSVNSYWRSVPATRNRRAAVLISEAGRAFKAACTLAAAAQCKKPLTGDVRVAGTVYFPNRRRDLDNCLKPLLDALQGKAYVNDSQVAHIDLRRSYDSHRPRVELTISQVEAE